jgi:hypothetical protein
MKAFKVITIVLVCWLVIGLICMLFDVPIKPYSDYWLYIGLGLALLQNFSLFRMILFKKK